MRTIVPRDDGCYRWLAKNLCFYQGGPVPCHVMASHAMPGHIFTCHAIFLRVMPCHEYSMPCHVRIFWENMFWKNIKHICPWSLFVVALRARSWLRGLNNRPDPPRKIGPVPCHAMSWLHVPCQAIFLRVMPYFCVSCRVMNIPCHAVSGFFGKNMFGRIFSGIWSQNFHGWKIFSGIWSQNFHGWKFLSGICPIFFHGWTICSGICP